MELACCEASASSTTWWPHGEQDGSRARFFVSKLGLEEGEEEAGPNGGQNGYHMALRPRPHYTNINIFIVHAQNKLLA